MQFCLRAFWGGGVKAAEVGSEYLSAQNENEFGKSPCVVSIYLNNIFEHFLKTKLIKMPTFIRAFLKKSKCENIHNIFEYSLKTKISAQRLLEKSSWVDMSIP